MSTARPQPYEWSRIGGHLALDLCNTVSWRLDAARTIERLTGPATLIDWFCTLTGESARTALEADLIGQPRRAVAALAAMRGLRAATIGLLDTHLDADTADDRDVATVTRHWRAALAVADVAPSLPLRPVITATTLPLLGAHLALSVADLLRGDRLGALRRCDGAGCGWLFLDTTRNHSRRWCDPLDCGNRARVRSYVQRNRQR
ncbi:MAG TPA: CGNR zinc finger domain-containing protein [Catenuloplanes sp.]